MSVVGLLLASCGSGTDESSATTDAAAEVTTGPTTVPSTLASVSDGGEDEPADTAIGTAQTEVGSVDLAGMSDEDLNDYELLADGCVYGGDATACSTMEAQYGVGADSNYGLGNSLTQAPTDALVGECQSFRSIACSELRTRFALSPDDDQTADTFAAAVIAGDETTLAALSGPGVLDIVTVGPFDPVTQEGIDVPGVFFSSGDSSFQFTTQATVFYTCWVGDGIVQFCRSDSD